MAIAIVMITYAQMSRALTKGSSVLSHRLDRIA